MARAAYICTHCGYEGTPVRPPSDEYSGQSDVSKSIGRVANLIMPGIGLLIRPMAMFLMLPVHILLWPLKSSLNPKKHCPNCGLPLMVKLSSDAGYVAKRRQEVKEGLVKFNTETLPPPVVFGKEVKFGDDKKEAAPEPPKLERLPSLEVLLQEPETAPPAEPEKSAEPVQPKKPVDPDQW